ncbi:M1 family metallopeptidase [Fretibacter rubidus]|uniref:M1 family metallopeptidase n=1 Tax=Fretibacter rubidus TaxID=570162 RepID=UPI00352AFA65
MVEHAPLPATDIRDREIPLRGITARGSGDRIQYGLENTAGILEAIEGYFGIPYPYEKLDIIAAPDYAFGAMENPGAIVYREYLMLMDENSALSQRRAYASVHSHEIAHQWFGNLVTPVWWEDIWLNEAFATWMGNKGINLWNPDGNFDRNTLRSSLGAMNIDTLSTTRKVREPLERSENVMDQFDGITYRKGGGVLDMFESYLGEDKFQAGVRLHMARYADGVATGDDFFQSIADGSGNKDVVAAMKSFVDQPGLPIVDAAMSCTGGKAAVKLSQSRYAPLGSKTQQGQSWQIPVCAKFGYADGSTQKVCSLMKRAESTMNRMDENCPTFVMPNENGAGYYRFSLDNEGWTALLANLDKLNTREVLTVQDSLESAFRAGKVDASVFIKGMETLAASSEYDVASGAGDWLSWFYDRLPETSRPDVARLTTDMYAARYKAIAGTDTVEGDLLAPTLAARLVSMGGDTALKADFAAKGQAYLAGDKDAIAPNMLSRALRAAMEAKDTFGTAERLLNMAKDGSSFEKGAAIGALAQTKNPSIAAMLRDTALVDDVTLTGRQATSLISTMLGSDELGEETWAWFKQNFKLFVDTRVPDVRKGGMPGFGGRFCSTERRDEVRDFFTENAAVIPGYERSLAQTLESIELCAALKEAKADETVAALKAR